jgi:hypothetical protein
MESLKDLQLQNEEVKSAVEILTKEKQEKEIHQLHQDLNKERSRNQKLQKRLNKLECDCAQEKLIHEQLRQNQIDLKHDLEMKTTVRKCFSAKRCNFGFYNFFFL